MKYFPGNKLYTSPICLNDAVYCNLVSDSTSNNTFPLIATLGVQMSLVFQHSLSTFSWSLFEGALINNKVMLGKSKFVTSDPTRVVTSQIWYVKNEFLKRRRLNLNVFYIQLSDENLKFSKMLPDYQMGNLKSPFYIQLSNGIGSWLLQPFHS